MASGQISLSSQSAPYVIQQRERATRTEDTKYLNVRVSDQAGSYKVATHLRKKCNRLLTSIRERIRMICVNIYPPYIFDTKHRPLGCCRLCCSLPLGWGLMIWSWGYYQYHLSLWLVIFKKHVDFETIQVISQFKILFTVMHTPTLLCPTLSLLSTCVYHI